jgi:hypothetical protein
MGEVSNFTLKISDNIDCADYPTKEKPQPVSVDVPQPAVVVTSVVAKIITVSFFLP